VVDDELGGRVVRELVRTTVGVIDVVDAVASAGSGKDKVMTVVDVKEDTVTSIKTIANLLVSRILDSLELKVADAVHGSPDDIAAVGIATVVGEPGIHLARIATPATVGAVHGNRSDGTARLADSVTNTGAELVASPAGVALEPGRGINPTGSGVESRGRNSNNGKNNKSSHYQRKKKEKPMRVLCGVGVFVCE